MVNMFPKRLKMLKCHGELNPRKLQPAQSVVDSILPYFDTSALLNWYEYNHKQTDVQYEIS